MALKFLKSDYSNQNGFLGLPLFGNGVYMIIDIEKGGSYVNISLDYGATWNRKSIINIKYSYYGCYDPVSNLFIVIGDNENVYTITLDGLTIQQPSILITSGQDIVIYALNGQIYTLGQDQDTGANILLRSSNQGQTWETLDFLGDTDSNNWVSYATNGNDQFVMVATGTICYSSDGINWAYATSGVSDNTYMTVSWANNIFNVGYDNINILTSANGINWFPSGSTINQFSQYSAATPDLFCFGGLFGETSGMISGPNLPNNFVDDDFPPYPLTPQGICASDRNFVAQAFDDETSSLYIYYTAPTKSAISFGLTWFFS